jgi:hypothetical protein
MEKALDTSTCHFGRWYQQPSFKVIYYPQLICTKSLEGLLMLHRAIFSNFEGGDQSRLPNQIQSIPVTLANNRTYEPMPGIKADFMPLSRRANPK